MSHTILKEYDDVKVFRIKRSERDDHEDIQLLSKLSSIEISPIKTSGDFVIKIVDCETEKERLVLEEKLSSLDVNFVLNEARSKRSKAAELNRVNIKLKSDKNVYYLVDMADKENYADFRKCISRISETGIQTRSKRTIASRDHQDLNNTRKTKRVRTQDEVIEIASDDDDDTSKSEYIGESHGLLSHLSMNAVLLSILHQISQLLFLVFFWNFIRNMVNIFAFRRPSRNFEA